MGSAKAVLVTWRDYSRAGRARHKIGVGGGGGGIFTEGWGWSSCQSQCATSMLCFTGRQKERQSRERSLAVKLDVTQGWAHSTINLNCLSEWPWVGPGTWYGHLVNDLLSPLAPRHFITVNCGLLYPSSCPQCPEWLMVNYLHWKRKQGSERVCQA